MAIRTLLFLLICTFAIAKDAPRTMTTRKVITASAFSDKRAKSLRSMKKIKKMRSPKSSKSPKSHWGVPGTRHKS